MISDTEYIETLIERNPLYKIFPVTEKSNHGIPLNIWEEVLSKHPEISYKREDMIFKGSNRKGERLVLI